MTVYKINPVGFAANCFLLTADGKNAVAIDPAQPRVLKEAQTLNLAVKAALFTHGHFDHIGGAAALSRAGAQIGCPEKEKELALLHNLGEELGGEAVEPFFIDFTVRDGEVLDLCGMKITVMETPGHTAGSVCYLTEGLLFSGDTLFCRGAGRSDLPTGSTAALRQSLKKLAALKGEYSVYCGHGEDTTLARELKQNPFLEA